MNTIKTNIIPSHPQFYWTAPEQPKELDLNNICIWAATGFFLDDSTFYSQYKYCKPGHVHTFDEHGALLNIIPWFEWNYSPRDITLNQATDEFEFLFEDIIANEVGERKVILPLSGGLDSRTQAAALWRLNKNVHTYSYAFVGGHDETEYGKRIAQVCGFPFEDWKVHSGYLWSCIEQLAHINCCYSEFTHPRQMAFVDRYAELGEVFNLGHWGDVLFDDMGVPDDLPFEKQVDVVLKKIVKKGGMELGSALWQSWGLTGDFREYLTERIKKLLADIDIHNSANARIRAFKSLYWAPRWTAVNLSIFESVRPITVPYFDNRMCRFICTVPEKHLAKRQIQIEYLKRRAPELARIPWQQHRPFNLYTYTWDKPPYNITYRGISKLKRMLNRTPLIQRNWELQFVGDDNEKHLTDYLFENPAFANWVPRGVVERFYKNFQQEQVFFSHPMSMLLTLSVASKQQAYFFG
ncbi:MAG: hypothetical protein KF687_12840 [Cyclobacteriaceae bacterium]|nr:hypothetical protein [Cyclobacteriaceae bacterium]